jgi:hypothetical protein
MDVVAQGSFTPSCVAGTACTFSTCFSWNDMPCVNECFNSDSRLEGSAVLALGCIHGSCGSECF